MPKRKTFDDDDEDEYIEEKKEKKIIVPIPNKKPKLKLENCPSVSSIKDLIDIGKQNKFFLNINSIMLWDILPYLEELENMIGMNSLKESLFYQIIYYLQSMHRKNQNEEYLHTVIMGSPGSGKTTVAKIIGNIYSHMGILSKNAPFKIAHREDFVGQYLGETANKTKKFLNSCIGGVIFIDEAYSLGPGSKDKDSFSKEALDTICSFLSEHKNDFCCIIAGYEEDIKKCFFSVNSGLERRFPWTHIIDTYTNKDLTQIFLKFVNNIKWELNKEINEEYLNKFFEINKEYFINLGGDIETFISKCKMVHSKRTISLNKEHRFIFTKQDIDNTLELFKKFKLKKSKKNYDYYT